MKMLIMYSGNYPIYAEGFSESCKRSCVGSLHLLPKKTITVTEEEYEHLKHSYPREFGKIRILAKDVDKKVEEKKEAAPAKEEPKKENLKPASRKKVSKRS